MMWLQSFSVVQHCGDSHSFAQGHQRALGTIWLDGCAVSAVAHPKRAHGFRVTDQKGEAHTLFAANDAERDQWIAAIEGISDQSTSSFKFHSHCHCVIEETDTGR